MMCERCTDEDVEGGRDTQARYTCECCDAEVCAEHVQYSDSAVLCTRCCGSDDSP